MYTAISSGAYLAYSDIQQGIFPTVHLDITGSGVDLFCFIFDKLHYSSDITILADRLGH